MKKVFILFLMMLSLVPFINDKIDVSAKENSLKHSSVNNSNALSYDVIIEDKIVNFNSEIYISFVLNDEATNYAVSLINASFIPLERIIEQDETIDVYVSNNHEPGEHSFDINVQDENGLSFTQSIYIYSDGIRDCVSSSCIEESKDIYFCNFVATQEELVILGREEEPEGMIYTTTYHETMKKYEDFIYKNGDISCVATRIIDNIDGKLKITGTIQWLDSSNNLQPLKNNYVYLYDDDVIIDDYYGFTRTDEHGKFTFTINNSVWLENGGLDLFIMVYATNDASFVTNFWTYYMYTSPIFDNVSDNSLMDYDIIIEPGTSNRANSFEISQMMYYSQKYVKEMSDVSLPAIEVIYPNAASGCYYWAVPAFLCMDQGAYDSWDVGMHEYGHYVDDYFNFSPLVGGDHWFNTDLAYEYNKTKGLKLAYSEALATYIGISAQLYFNLSSAGIPTVGDYSYSSYNGATWNGLNAGFGESDEGSIFGFLLTLADDISGRSYDKISLGYEGLWEILDSEKRTNVSDLIEDIIDEYPELTNELGLLLERYGFAPRNITSSNSLDSRNTGNTFTWNANRTHTNTVSELNKYSLKFYSSDLKNSYQIDNITATSYTLTTSDLNNILSLNGNTIYWQVIGYNTRSFLTGPYNSSLKQISKPSFINIYLDNNYSSSLNAEESIWYRFVVPKTGTYEFKTTGSSDTYGELFTSIVADTTTLNRLENGYDDDSGDGYNFNIEYELEYKQVVYLRVRGFNYNAVDNFTLSVVCTHHEHEFEYEPIDSQYHILECHCGETSGSQSRHVIDGTYIDPIGNGRFKPCAHCGAAIDTWAGGIYPVLINNNQVVYVMYENRIDDNEISTMNIENHYESMSINCTQYTSNGSYKMDDGTIILVEEDLEAYLDGTLIFYDNGYISQIE